MVIVQRDWSAFMLQSDFASLAPQAQSLFLQDAMDLLGLGKEAFATRIGVSKKCLDKWLSANGSTEFRQMNRMAWKFITEILERVAEQD